MKFPLSPALLWGRAKERDEVRHLLTFVLLLVILFSAAYGIAKVLQGVDTGFLSGIGFLALVVGWLLARSSLDRWVASFWGLTVGGTILIVRVGRLMETLVALLRELNLLAMGLGRYGVERLWHLFYESAVPEIFPPDPTALFSKVSVLVRAVVTLLWRTMAWLVALLQDKPIYDPAAISLAWGGLFWAVMFWASWMVFRQRKPLLAVLPTGVVLAWTLSYTWGTHYPLWFFMGAVSILMAMVSHEERETQWIAANIDFSRDVRVDLLGAAALVTLGLMLASILAPSLSVENLRDIVRRLTEPRGGNTERVGDSLGLERQSYPGAPDVIERASAGGLPRRHLIGSGEELSHRVVMVVKTGELAPMPEAALTMSPPSYYWRGITYDVYSGRGWYASDGLVDEYGAGEPSRETAASSYRLLRQEVEFVGDAKDLVYVAGIFVVADHPYTVAWRTSGDFLAATLDADPYRADSLVPEVSDEVLRAASVEYPAWIRNRYLVLPGGMPDRVLNLARDLTATELTPYDRALAIERYLRENYTYTLDVSIPSHEREIADYFLFDLKKGYCDYYATAMAVLARAAGLPARLAVGYATGTYEAPEARYVVTEADAHAWVEIYFPGYGWIPFEPTAGLPSLDRDAHFEPPEWPETGTSLRPPPPKVGPILISLGLVSLGLSAVAGLVALVGAQIDLLLRRFEPPERVVSRLYGRARRWADYLGMSFYPGDTPIEFGDSFARWVDQLSAGRRWRAWALPAAEELRFIVTRYIQAWYSPRALEIEDRDALLSVWRTLRWRLWLLWVWNPWPTLDKGPLGKLLSQFPGWRRKRVRFPKPWERPQSEQPTVPLPPQRF